MGQRIVVLCKGSQYISIILCSHLAKSAQKVRKDKTSKIMQINYIRPTLFFNLNFLVSLAKGALIPALWLF